MIHKAAYAGLSTWRLKRIYRALMADIVKSRRLGFPQLAEMDERDALQLLELIDARKSRS